MNNAIEAQTPDGVDLLKSFNIEKEVDHNTLSARLNYVLRMRRVSQSELARRINVKPQVIQYLCGKNIKNSRFTFEIADALEVNHTWLAVGEGPMCPIDVALEKTHYKVPLISWNNLNNYTENGKANDGSEK